MNYDVSAELLPKTHYHHNLSKVFLQLISWELKRPVKAKDLQLSSLLTSNPVNTEVSFWATADYIYGKKDGLLLWKTQVLLMSCIVKITVTNVSLFAPFRKWSINQVWWCKLVIPVPKAKAGWLWFWGQLGWYEDLKARPSYLAKSFKERKKREREKEKVQHKGQSDS